MPKNLNNQTKLNQTKLNSILCPYRYTQVFAGRAVQVCSYVETNCWTLLMNSSWLKQPCSACIVSLAWMVCKMGSKWPHSRCFVESCFQDLLKNARNINFSLNVSLVFRWWNYTVALTRPQLRRNLILFHQWSDFHMIDNQTIAVHAFPMSMFTSLSVNKILLPWGLLHLV